ncbi:MAG: hypothetical protein K8U03_24850 [Planctomycetia bacterium]|nr:hypothetical protein [Planctomycetia bacterium]
MDSRSFIKSKETNHAKPPILDALNAESDRGCALVAAEYIDDQLGEVLLFSLVKMASKGGDRDAVSNVIRQFSVDLKAKSGLCLAIGLISCELYQSIQYLKDVRNFMAHFSGSGELSDDLVHTFVTTLAPELRSLRDLSQQTKRIFDQATGPVMARENFIDSVACISVWLNKLYTEALSA